MDFIWNLMQTNWKKIFIRQSTKLNTGYFVVLILGTTIVFFFKFLVLEVHTEKHMGKIICLVIWEG